MKITAGAYLEGAGIKVGLANKSSVDEADYALDLDERVYYAMLANFSIDGKACAGVVVVTTHRLLCCASVADNTTVATLPYSCSIGIGDIRGAFFKEMPVSCDGVSVRVKASAADLDKLRTALLDAIEAAPNQGQIAFSPSVMTHSAEQQRVTKELKDANRNVRSLSAKARAPYVPCPGCGGHAIVAARNKRGGEKIYCQHCGHIFVE